MKDKSIATQQQLENEIRKLYRERGKKPSLFEVVASDEEDLKAAYRMLNKEVAFSPAERKRKFN